MRTRSRLPIEARWALTGLAFPPAGLLAITLAPVTSVPTALGAGVAAGAVIGTGQWLALRSLVGRPGAAPRWIAATGVAMAVGLAAGAAAVGYSTTTRDLVLMGAVTGAVLGPAQAVLLRRFGLVSVGGAAVWAATVPVVWALGWWVTASSGIDVERHYTNFGIYGSMTASAVAGLVLGRLTRRGRR